MLFLLSISAFSRFSSVFFSCLCDPKIKVARNFLLKTLKPGIHLKAVSGEILAVVNKAFMNVQFIHLVEQDFDSIHIEFPIVFI